MNVTAKTLVGALLLTVAAGGALAQVSYTRDTVSRADPFGAVPIDPLTFAINQASFAALGPTNVADLNARCDVVIHWPSYYGWGTAAFCENVLYAQGLIDDPTAPDTSTSGWVTTDSSDSSDEASEVDSASE